MCAASSAGHGRFSLVTDDMKIDERDMKRRIDRAALDFDSADFVHAVTRRGLLDRLAPLVVDARRVLDLGCATGSAEPHLRKRFRRALIVSLDLSRAMLEANLGKSGWLSRRYCVQARAEALPFDDDSFDVIFSNQLLPWIEDLGAVLEEVSRVLRPEGVFAFATLGPDSLRELAEAWRSIDDFSHVRRFPDMHDVGDALVRAALRDPVLDVDRLEVRYKSPDSLWRDLTAIGARNVLGNRNPALTSTERFDRMLGALQASAQNDDLRFDLELVYGHCWGGSGPRQGADFRIDAGTIGHRRR